MSAPGRSALAATAGDGLLHPIPLLAIGVLLLNDHVLKATYPGLVTGKLSDLAGLVYFPLLLQGIWEVMGSHTGRDGPPSHRTLLVAILATAVAFTIINLSPAGSGAYGAVMGTLQWAIGVLPRAILDGQVPTPKVVANVVDAGDMVALPALAIAYAVGRRRVLRPLAGEERGVVFARS